MACKNFFHLIFPFANFFFSSTSVAALTSVEKTGSKSVFEGRTSTGSEPFSLFICRDATKFVLLSFFTLIETIWRKRKPMPMNEKGLLPRLTCVEFS